MKNLMPDQCVLVGLLKMALCPILNPLKVAKNTQQTIQFPQISL